MPNNTNIRNGNSAGAASTTPPNPVGGSGELPVSALADALAAFDGQAGTRTNNQGTPGAEEPGRTQPEGQTVEQPENITEPNEQREEPGEEPDGGNPESNGEVVEDPEGEVPEEESEQEETEGTEEDRTEQIPKGLQKRIGQMLGKIRELEGKLAQAASNAAGGAVGTQRPTTSPLDSVTDVGELERREGLAEQVLSEIEPMIARLAYAPAQVEKYLRTSGIALKNEAGEEDYSVERMGDLLLNTKAQNAAILKAVPARKAWLQNHAQAHAQVVKVKPWVGDASDERHAEMQNILRQFPGLKSAPNYEYWLACAIEGHRATVQQLKAAQNKTRPNGAGAVGTQRPTSNGARRGLPASAAGGSGAPRVQPNQKKVSDAKAKVTKEGTVGALSEFLDASGIAV